MRDDRLDDEARAELEAEAQRHRESLRGLTLRETEAVVAESSRHLHRVKEIMRQFTCRAVG